MSGNNSGLTVSEIVGGGSSGAISQVHNSVSIPKLIGSNYQSWKELVEIVLTLKGLDAAIRRNVEVKVDLHARLIILESMDESHRSQVRGCSSAKEIFQRLELVYADNSAANVYRLLHKYYRYKKLETDSVSQHIGKMDEMRNALAQIDEKQSDRLYQVTLIGSLPEEYQSMMEIWELTHPDMRTNSNLVARLLKKEEDLRNKELQASSFIARAAKPGKFKSIEERKKETKCHRCGEKGHWAAECRKSRGERRSDEAEGPKAHILFNVSKGEGKARSVWIMDSGASHHMCNDITFFKTYTRATSNLSATVGNGAPVAILGTGEIEVQCKVGDRMVNGKLRDVAYMPQITVNLFSTGAADAVGITSSTRNGKCVLRKDDEVVALAFKRQDNLWYMAMSMVRPSKALTIKGDQTIEEWHQIMGHASKERIEQLKAQGVIGDSNEGCGTCAAGKGKKSSHPAKEDERAAEPGEKVYVDLAHINKETSDYCYYFLCKDEATEYCLIYLAKRKTDMPKILARLLVDFEAGCGKPIKTIMSDNGSEICNQACSIELLRQGVRHVTTGIYAPQQNGIVEREVQSINNIARSMLIDAQSPGLPAGEALRTACYIRNRLPTKRSQTTPYERFTGQELYLKHMRKFGSEVHVIRTGEHLGKFDRRTSEGYFVGYTSRRNTYRIYLPARGTVIETCDVIFRPHTKTRKQGDENSEEASVMVDLERVRKPEKVWCTGGRLEKFFDNFRQENRRELANNKERETEAEDNAGQELRPPTPPERNSSLARRQNDLFTTCNDTMKSDQSIQGPRSSTPATAGEPNDDTLVGCMANTAKVEENLNAVDDRVMHEPRNRREALSRDDAGEWRRAEEIELGAHEENQTWTESVLPETERALSVKWVYTIKRDHAGNVERYKARLVARGFEQRPGIDYGDTFAPVVGADSFRLVLALAAIKKWSMRQFDVSTAFPNGVLTEDIYIKAPEGVKLEKGNCLKLNKSLYGLKQSPKCWNSRFNTEMLELGFYPTTTDQCVYTNKSRKMTVLVYVDDGLVFGETEAECDELIAELNKRFKTNRVETGMFLGIRIRRDGNRVCIGQARYIQDMLEKFKMVECAPASSPMFDRKALAVTNEDSELSDDEMPYRQLIGSLQYCASKTRPDILFAVNFLSRFLSRPQRRHWQAAVRVLKYLKATIEHEIVYEGDRTEIVAYSDADFANEEEDRRSVSGILILIGGGPVVFASRRQSNISQSTAEAEYVAACDCAKELVWLRGILTELDVEFDKPRLIVDNLSAMRQIKSSETLRRSKHVELKFHFVRESFNSGLFSIEHVGSQDQLADALTKSIGGSRLKEVKRKINIIAPIKVSCYLLTMTLLGLPPKIANMPTVDISEPAL